MFSNLWTDFKRGEPHAISLGFLGLILSGLLLWLFCWLADTSFLPRHFDNKAVVINHRHSEAHTTITHGANGQVNIINHPESWNVVIRTKKGSGEFQVSEDEYNRIREGDIVEVGYKIARFSGDIIITDFYRQRGRP